MNYIPIKHEKIESKTGVKGVVTYVEIGRDTIIFPSTYIAAGTRIGKNCQIGPFVYLKGVTIPDNSVIIFEKRVKEA